MNLYRINFLHAGPKDRAEGIVGYLLAENDEQVYDYINENICSSWLEEEEYGEGLGKERILEIHGDMYDEDFDFSDAYYGITLYGWELIKENASGDYREMIELGIISTL